ncbi:MAG: hypothetical protein EON93_18950 [Burkholderiales bacterium]|nr:MAG: hypothetical protein EON93_18950 [Burkholderiales bacterium]
MHPGSYWLKRLSDGQWVVANFEARWGWNLVGSLTLYRTEELFEQDERGEALFEMGPRMGPAPQLPADLNDHSLLCWRPSPNVEVNVRSPRYRYAA